MLGLVLSMNACAQNQSRPVSTGAPATSVVAPELIPGSTPNPAPSPRVFGPPPASPAASPATSPVASPIASPVSRATGDPPSVGDAGLSSQPELLIDISSDLQVLGSEGDTETEDMAVGLAGGAGQ